MSDLKTKAQAALANLVRGDTSSWRKEEEGQAVLDYHADLRATIEDQARQIREQRELAAAMEAAGRERDLEEAVYKILAAAKNNDMEELNRIAHPIAARYVERWKQDRKRPTRRPR